LKDFTIHIACGRPVSFPIVLNDRAVGAISLGRTQPNKPFTSEEVATMRSLAQHGGTGFPKREFI